MQTYAGVAISNISCVIATLGGIPQPVCQGLVHLKVGMGPPCKGWKTAYMYDNMRIKNGTTRTRGYLVCNGRSNSS